MKAADALLMADLHRSKNRICRRCKCGCGEITNLGKKWIFGHHMRGRKLTKEWKENISKTRIRKRKIRHKCKCGCGKVTNPGRKYINTHHIDNKGINNPMYGKRGVECPNYGRRRPDITGENNPSKRPEVRKKLSENHARAMLGKKHTPEARKNISKNHRDIKGVNNPMYRKGYLIEGENNPSKRPEVRKKISETLTGKFVGDKNPSWKGGISTEPYCHVWADKEYKNSIRERDGWFCQNPVCRKNNQNTTPHLHHINYDKKNCHPWNLISICKSCNSRANKNRKRWAIFYQKIMSRKYGYKYN